jgi:hypothetical protein
MGNTNSKFTADAGFPTDNISQHLQCARKRKENLYSDILYCMCAVCVCVLVVYAFFKLENRHGTD